MVRRQDTDRDKDWPPNTPCALEAEDNSQQLPPTLEINTQGLGEQMQNNNQVRQVSTNIHFTNLKMLIF